MFSLNETNRFYVYTHGIDMLIRFAVRNRHHRCQAEQHFFSSHTDPFFFEHIQKTAGAT